MIYATYMKENAPTAGTGIRLAIYQGQGHVGSKNAVERNLNVLENAVIKAKNMGAHLISFSELYLTGYTVYKEDIPALAETVDGPSMLRISKIAKDNEIAILCPYPEKDGDKYYDSMALFDKDGSLLSNYRKAHLWGTEEKKKWISGYLDPKEGNAFDVIKVNDFPIGLLNCYEAEFPELTRILALKGAKLVVIPTAADEWEWVEFPEKDTNGRFIPRTGTKTSKPYPDISKNVIPVHAQESTIFVAYCNGYGLEMDGDNEMMDFLGNSVVANPNGEIMVAAKKEETLLIADCITGDYSSIHPRDSDYLLNRRPDLYKDLVKISK